MQISDKKLGFYAAYLPWYYRAATKNALILAERELQRPVYGTDVLACWNRVTYIPKVANVFVWIALRDLYRNDELLGDT